MSVIAMLLPVFGLIGLGFGLRVRGFLPADFWRGAERLTYFIAFPALLFREAAKVTTGGLPILEVAIAALLPIAVAAAALAVAWPLLASRVTGARYSSLFQAAIRPNTYLALATAAAVGGADGLAAIALGVVLVIPTVNLLSIVAVARLAGTARNGSHSGLRLFRVVLLNPLIIGSVAGLAAGVTGVQLPAAAAALLEQLARLALPLGLLTVGAALSPRGLAAARALLAASAIGKLIALPLVAGLVCAGLGLSGAPAVVLTAYAAMPASPSSYVLARELGGDAALMANLITAHTVAAVATLPAILWAATLAFRG